ncbi:hypothetical protein H7X66_17785, partial [Dysgonomonas sp. BGC7]|uniref:hypothetical protein n=1 Tax=Dysgonomonas sp. BGC7 TaxID=1658008 RepID=UPI0017843BEF
MNKTIKNELKMLLIGVFLLFILWLFTSCKPQYIPVESIRTEWRDKYIRDSIFEKEFVRIYQIGDTIFKDSIVYKYKDKLVKDTVNITDTIRVPYPIKGDIIEVNKLKWWQEASVWFTSLVLVSLALYLSIKYRAKIFSFLRKL